MNLKTKIFHIKNRFGELWEHAIFRYAILLHVFYFVLSMILVLVFFRNQNDFLVYYQAGGVFLNGIENLYNQNNYLWDFRYFPLSAAFFVPFFLLGFDLGFILFHFINLILNILICVLLYKIITLVKEEDHEKDDSRVILYISLYLMGLPHVFNYILGQINLYVTLLVIISLYIFIKYNDLKWNIIGSLILGLSLIIKPTSIFMVPFLIVISFDRNYKKIKLDIIKSVSRLVFVIVPLMLNFILFYMFPKLWKDFLKTNFTGESLVEMNFSYSITRLIINFCYFYGIPFDQLIIFFSVALTLSIIGGLIFIFGKFGENQIIYGYLIAILVLLLSYFDTWDHHLLIITPILIIIIFNLPRHSEITKKYIKPSFFFLSFLDLAFMGIWFLTQDWFPYNFASTIFLTLTFYGIIFYGLNKDLKNQ